MASTELHVQLMDKSERADGFVAQARIPGEDRSVSVLVIHTVLAFSLTVGSLVVGMLLAGHFFEVQSVHPEFTSVASPAAFVGVLLLFFGLPIGVLGLGWTTMTLSRMVERWGTRTAQAAVAAVGAAELIWGIVCIPYLCTPGQTYDNSNPPDGFWQLIGSLQVSVFVPLGVVTLLDIVPRVPAGRGLSGGEREQLLEEEDDGLDSALEKDSLRGSSRASSRFLAWRKWYERCGRPRAGALDQPAQPVRAEDNWPAAAGSLLLLLLLIAATSMLTNVWNFTSHSYFQFFSPYSLTQAYIGPADAPYVAFKVYEDVVVFYCFLFFVSAVAFSAYVWPEVASVLHARVRVLSPQTADWNPWHWGVSIGEIMLMTAIAALYIYWIDYWGVRYQRIREESSADDLVSVQVAARVLGHVLTLTMSFLLVPATRNSMLESVFGIPFERSLKYHRMLGGLVWLLVTLHMVVWWVKWGKQGLLGNNIVTINNLRVDPVNTHYDNFTVLAAELAWIPLTVMVVVAVFFRRTHFELFQYTHYFGIVFFLIGVLHAWGFWYYTAGGMILWMVDRLTRLGRASVPAPVVSVETHQGVTRVKLRATDAQGAPFLDHYAGQYAFVNIPAVSETEWHPITISSPPHARVRTFHIKALGGKSWTEDVARMANAHMVASVPGQVTVAPPTTRIDGAYGRPVNYLNSETVLLIAGGIGITPLHSIFMDLYARACAAVANQGAGTGSIKHVHLVWSSREPALFNIFAESFYPLARVNPNTMFHISLYDTRRPHYHHAAGSGGGGAGGGGGGGGMDSADEARFVPPFSDISADAVQWLQAQVLVRRPALGSIFEEAVGTKTSPGTPARTSNVIALTCGPKAMVDEVSELCFAYGATFHAEEFHF